MAPSEHQILLVEGVIVVYALIIFDVLLAACSIYALSFLNQTCEQLALSLEEDCRASIS